MEESEHVILMKLNCLKNFFVKNLFNLKTYYFATDLFNLAFLNPTILYYSKIYYMYFVYFSFLLVLTIIDQIEILLYF